MLTPDNVGAWVRESSPANLDAGIRAVNAYVSGLAIVADNGGEWSDTVTLAATMLLARWLRRRNSPNGVEAATDVTVTYIARYDSDISRMLQIDGFQKPQVG
ncbi:hypothetical protein [Canibacter zhoujuaniae]|uniref:hypothetical protein n=1 Tax=Canibacter zhoujuaniae TaxID=2708343 RepID=UPI00141DB1B2|nr:hypothetical protein [Canibacter zhoujuaniae]